MGVNALIAQGGNFGSPDISQLFATAYKIKQMQADQRDQNALKALFTNPSNLDPKTGEPTQPAMVNALKAGLSPKTYMGLTQESAKIENERALTDERALKQKVEKDNILNKFVREPAATAYDNAIKAGSTPEVATATAQRVYDEGLNTVRQSGEFSKAETDQFSSSFDIDLVRAAMKVNQLHNQPKGSDIDVETDQGGNTYRLNKITGETTGVSGPDVDPGKPYQPQGRVSRIGGGGMARSAIAMATQRYVQEHPDASADDITEFAAQYKRTQVTGTADVEAASKSLANIEKTRGMVTASEGNANREADLVLSLVDKGGGNLPRFFNKPLQDLKVQGLGNTDAAALRVATESFKNEYVKVLSTQSGVSGGMSTDSARKEADAFINDGLSIDQIKRNIEIMRKSMNNRKAALDDAYEQESGRVQGGKRGPDSPGAEAAGGAPPRTARTPPLSTLQENHVTTYKNGQKWTLRNGKPVQITQ